MVLPAVLLSYDWQNGSIPLVEDWRDWRNVGTLVFYTSLAAALVYSWINRKVSLLQHLFSAPFARPSHAIMLPSLSSPFDFFWPGQLGWELGLGRYRRRPFHNVLGAGEHSHRRVVR